MFLRPVQVVVCMKANASPIRDIYHNIPDSRNDDEEAAEWKKSRAILGVEERRWRR